MSRKRQNAVLCMAAVLWIAGIAYGYTAMIEFQRKAGDAAVAPILWPATSPLVRAKDAPTVVVFAHPRCPCTRATVSQLRTLLGSSAGAAVRTYVLVLKPHEFPEGWEKTDVWRSAASIPGVTVLSDLDGREAARLGARTSGQTLVYNARGQLVFSGGITALRGEIGDNLGEQSVAAIVDGRQPIAVATPVYGCAIQDKHQAPAPSAGKL